MLRGSCLTRFPEKFGVKFRQTVCQRFGPRLRGSASKTRIGHKTLSEQALVLFYIFRLCVRRCCQDGLLMRWLKRLHETVPI